MATLIAKADGNLTGAGTFAAAETGTGSFAMIRFSTATIAGAATFTSSTFTVTNGNVIDAVLLWLCYTDTGASGTTLKVALHKSGVEQCAVTVNKIDLTPNITGALNNPQPVLFKFTTTATGDGAATWTIVLTTAGTNVIQYYRNTSTSADITRALRTTTAATLAAGDNFFILGEKTGAGTYTSRAVVMDSQSATVYGNGLVTSTVTYGGQAVIGNYGSLTYGTAAGVNYILRLAGELLITANGTVTINTVAGTSSSDPYWSDVKLLLGFDGADASTTVTDESPSLRGNATVYGNTQIDTAQSKFGGASLLLDGTGDYISFPNHADFNFGTGPFTFEGYYRFSGGTLHALNAIFMAQWGGGFLWWSELGTLVFRDNTGGYSTGYPWVIVYNQWYKITVDRDASSVLRIYLDGTMVAKTTGYNHDISGSTEFALGDWSGGGYGIIGWMDEVRITKGVARYGSDSGYTVATSAFPRATLASSAVLEFQQVSADGDFGVRMWATGALVTTGQPRTPGKNVVKCKLTANVTSTSQTQGFSTTGMNTSVVALDASETSMVAYSAVENTSNSAHGISSGTPASISDTTQTGTMWLARGTGANNRYVRFMVSNGSSPITGTNGFYVDVDMQAGTIGTVTAMGTGTATSASITPVGRGFLIRMTGKCSSGASVPTLHAAGMSAPGTLTYVGSGASSFVYDHFAIVNAASVSDTTFNVDTDTGWLSGDAIIVASTTTVIAECEIYPLAADAGASSMVSKLYPFGNALSGGNFAVSTHHGTAPIQAEVALLTRNVKIRSTSSSLMAYFDVGPQAALNMAWTEICFMGTGVSPKRGIEIAGATGWTAGSKNLSYCSIHDNEIYGIMLVTNGITSINTTISNCVMWNFGNDGIQVSALWATNGTALFDYNINNTVLMRSSSDGMELIDGGHGQVYGNTIVGCNNGIVVSNASDWATTVSNFSNNTTHSNSAAGFTWANPGNGVVDGITSWRNGQTGITFSNNSHGMGNMRFKNGLVFGNLTRGLYTLMDQMHLTNFIICGDTTYACPSGIQTQTNLLQKWTFDNVDTNPGTGIFVPNSARDIYHVVSPLSVGMELTGNDCRFGASIFITGNTPLKGSWSNDSFAAFQRWNKTNGSHRTEMKYGLLQTDVTNYHTLAPSMRMTPSSTTKKLPSATIGHGIMVPIESGQAVLVSVWIRKDPAYYSNQPRMIARANPSIGISADTVLATCSEVTGGSTNAIFNYNMVSSLVVTNNNLTVAAGPELVSKGASSSTFHSTGKYYFEITVQGFAYASNGIGIMRTDATYSGVLTNGANGALAGGNGLMYVNGSSPGSLGAPSVGDVECVAVDFDAHLIWFRKNAGNWNNSGTANPATGAGGLTIQSGSFTPFAAFWSNSTASAAYTANFGATTFAQAVPSGFTPGWTVPAGYVGTGAWTQLSGTTPTATDDGVVEVIVDCDGIVGYVNVDDWAKDGTVICDMSVWSNGLPMASGGGGGGGGETFHGSFA